MGTKPITHLKDVREGGRRSRLRLLAPLRYLGIRHTEKQRYDTFVPLVFALIGWCAYLLIRPQVPLFGDPGLLRFTRDLLIMAIPFMVGALAAVAMGAPGPQLDKRPVGSDLYLGDEALTLRQF